MTDLRAHHQNLFVAAKLTAAVVATSGPATEPRALLNAKTELQGVGVVAISEIRASAVERALKFGVDSADWAYVWRILCPEPGPCPRVWAHIDSIPTFADAEEDERVLKLKTTFQRTWAVGVLVDLLRLEKKRESVEHYLKACPFEALL